MLVINIPDNVLYTKDLVLMLSMKYINKSSTGLTDVLNDKTGMPYTKPEAEEFASSNRKQALDMYNQLLK